MIKLTAGQMVAALKQCSSTPQCDGCPYQEMLSAKCIQQMQHDAAAMIEGMQGMIEQQADTITKTRRFVRSNK